MFPYILCVSLPAACDTLLFYFKASVFNKQEEKRVVCKKHINPLSLNLI